MPVFRDSEGGSSKPKGGLISNAEMDRLKKIDPELGPTRCKHCGNHSTIIKGKRTCCGAKDEFDPLDGRR